MNALRVAIFKVERFIRYEPGFKCGSLIYEPEEQDFSANALLTRRYLGLAVAYLRTARSVQISSDSAVPIQTIFVENEEIANLEGPEGVELGQFIAAVNELATATRSEI